jgi:hypothetical protein
MAIIYRNNPQLPTQQDYEEAYARSAATDRARANALRDELESWGAGTPQPVGTPITIGDIFSTIGGGARAAGRDILGLLGATAGAVGRGAGYAGELAGRGVAAGASAAGRGLAALGSGVVGAGQGALAAGQGVAQGLGGVARGAGGVMQGVGNLGLHGTQALGYGAKALGQGAIAAAQGAGDIGLRGARAIGNAGIGAANTASSTVGNLLGRFNREDVPAGSRSDDYRNLSSGINLTPQSFGLEYRQPTTPVQPQAKVFDMPAVRQEQPEDSRMTTDSMSFRDAFRTYRDMMGPGAIFMWNGKQYTTDMAEDVKPQPVASEAKQAVSDTQPVRGSQEPSGKWLGSSGHDSYKSTGPITSGRDNNVTVQQMYDEDVRSKPDKKYMPSSGSPKTHGIREDGPREYYDYMFERFFGPGGIVDGKAAAIKNYDNKYLYYNNGDRVGWEELMAIEQGRGRGTVTKKFLAEDIEKNMPAPARVQTPTPTPAFVPAQVQARHIAGPTHTSSY